jgi:3-carboxy-cis,cis-muconate cycloisomerase
MLEVEAALARAEAKLGLVPATVADAITAAARVDNLNLQRLAESTRKVGYPVVELVRQLGDAAGAQAARYVHFGATTQDIIDTATVLQIRQATALLRLDLIATARALADLAKRYRDTPMAGRTHLQHAVPIAFGFKCAVWAAPLINHVERLDQAASRTQLVQFGGAAGTLAPLGNTAPAVVEALAHELDLGVPLLPWHVIRDGFAETAALLGLICGSLGKFAFDVILLMQSEVAEVAEPFEPGRGGSSTMPHKRNPVASEFIVAAARGVHALVAVMLGATIQDHERSSGSWQSESLALSECFVLTAGALTRARFIAERLAVDVKRMRRNLDAGGGLIMAEAVSSALTPAMGRAAAHESVQRACDRAISEGKSLRQVLREDSKISVHLTESEIERLLEPGSYLGSAGAFVDRVAAKVAALT